MTKMTTAVHHCSPVGLGMRYGTLCVVIRGDVQLAAGNTGLWCWRRILMSLDLPLLRDTQWELTDRVGVNNDRMAFWLTIGLRRWPMTCVGGQCLAMSLFSGSDPVYCRQCQASWDTSPAIGRYLSTGFSEAAVAAAVTTAVVAENRQGIFKQFIRWLSEMLWEEHENSLFNTLTADVFLPPRHRKKWKNWKKSEKKLFFLNFISFKNDSML